VGFELLQKERHGNGEGGFSDFCNALTRTDKHKHTYIRHQYTQVPLSYLFIRIDADCNRA